MLILPAIDIINGCCVRLYKGNYKEKKVYSNDPIEVAKKWEEMGAKWLHIVDLDGAREGVLKNLDIAVKIKQNTKLNIEYGGGIRNLDSLETVLNSGIDRAILGIWAIEAKDVFEFINKKYKNRFIISIDFDSDGNIYKHGWQQKTDYNVFNFLKFLETKKINEIIVTNISRDGTLKGVDLKIIEKILQNFNVNLIIAGGVLDINDIKKLKDLGNLEKKEVKSKIENYHSEYKKVRGKVTGIIIGKALYENKINLRKAIEVANG